MKKNFLNFTYFVLKKIFQYGLHIGGDKHFSVLDMHSYFYGMRRNFYIYNLDVFLFLFSKAFRFLKNLLDSDKKILFIGLPVGLEQPFLELQKTYGHYVIDERIIGVLSNYRDLGLSKKFKIKEKPSLIFIFRPLDPDHQILLKSLFSFNIPIMGFVNINDPVDYFDFPIPGRINSFGGSLFVYNLFFYLLKLIEKGKGKSKKYNSNRNKQKKVFSNSKNFNSKKDNLDLKEKKNILNPKTFKLKKDK